MSKELRHTSFAEILPSSIASDSTMRAAASVLDAEFAGLDAAVDQLTFYTRIDSLEEPLLSHLAWQWHVDFWDADLSLNEKRALLKMAYSWHEKKGTPAAIEMVLADVLGGGRVEEWQDYGGKPKHFRVISQTAPGNERIYSQLLQAIGLAKNERSVLDTIIQSSPISGRVSVAGVCVASCAVTIKQEV